MSPAERTFAHELSDAGYRTAYVGKWHLADVPRTRRSRRTSRAGSTTGGASRARVRRSIRPTTPPTIRPPTGSTTTRPTGCSIWDSSSLTITTGGAVLSHRLGRTAPSTLHRAGVVPGRLGGAQPGTAPERLPPTTGTGRCRASTRSGATSTRPPGNSTRGRLPRRHPARRDAGLLRDDRDPRRQRRTTGGRPRGAGTARGDGHRLPLRSRGDDGLTRADGQTAPLRGVRRDSVHRLSPAVASTGAGRSPNRRVPRTGIPRSSAWRASTPATGRARTSRRCCAASGRRWSVRAFSSSSCARSGSACPTTTRPGAVSARSGTSAP